MESLLRKSRRLPIGNPTPPPIRGELGEEGEVFFFQIGELAERVGFENRFDGGGTPRVESALMGMGGVLHGADGGICEKFSQRGAIGAAFPVAEETREGPALGVEGFDALGDSSTTSPACI
jgi:hypothetical protein